jgi:hypothetical protein
LPSPERRAIDQQTVRCLCAAPDAPAQLMELGQTEPFGVLDYHDGSPRHVDADLDDRGGHEHPQVTIHEPAHRGVLVAPLHAAMDQADAVAELRLQRGEPGFCGGHFQRLGIVDERTYPVDLGAGFDRAPDSIDHVIDAADGKGARFHRPASGRLLGKPA